MHCPGDDRLQALIEERLSDGDEAVVLVHVETCQRCQQILERLTAVEPESFHRRDAPPERLGPYQLLREIGRGGMGTVYLAEQESPVRRRVALKVIRPGAAAPQAIARFQAERQALALMDHPGIAKVFDAGTTQDGRPYFVMELVDGVPITEYCDGARLSAPKRLQLFTAVCRAIEHAHQKGMIHRDIKPSNILVADVDGHPVPKIIDFGIAKAVDQRLVERTVFTQQGAIVGTPEYMSPEQASLDEADVDTRSDIFSLGVVLYELLTGTTPLGCERLREAAYSEILKRIKEEEPPKPSTRLTQSRASLAAIAETRGTEPRRLAKLLRGDLDWIVMKALEKDRNRRYETASAFARDVERHLFGDPVEAGPPSRAYRIRKFACKHSMALGVVVLLTVVPLVAASVSGVALLRARDAERLSRIRLADLEHANVATMKALAGARAAQKATKAALEQSEEAREQAEAVRTLLVDSFRSPDPAYDGRNVRVVDVLDRASQTLTGSFVGSQATKAALLNALGTTYRGLGLYERAGDMLEQAWAIREETLGSGHVDTLHTRTQLAENYLVTGRTADAIRLLESTAKLQTEKLGAGHSETLATLNSLAVAWRRAGQLAKAAAVQEETLKLQEAKLGARHPDTLNSRLNLGSLYRISGRTAEAVKLLEATVPLLDAAHGMDHPLALTGRHLLANAYLTAGRAVEAIALNEAILKARVTKLGLDHPDTLVSQTNLANAYNKVGRFAEAVRLNEATVKAQTAKLGAEHPDTLTSRNNLATTYQQVGRLADAIALHETTLAAREQKLGPSHRLTVISRINLAAALTASGRHTDAIPLLEGNLRVKQAQLGAEQPEVLQARIALGAAMMAAGETHRAEALLLPTVPLASRVLGASSIHVLEVRSILAAIAREQGRLADAESQWRAVIADRRKNGRPRGGLARDLVDLAEDLLAQSRWTEAEPLLREALAMQTDTRPSNRERFWNVALLGESEYGSGRSADGERLLGEGHDGLKQCRGAISATQRRLMRLHADRVIRLIERAGHTDRSRAWKFRLGLADLPEQVFARP